MVTRTSARFSASHARIGAYASKIGFQVGSLSRRRSLANPIVGVCDVAIAPMIFAMIALLLGVKLLNVGSHHPYAKSRSLCQHCPVAATSVRSFHSTAGEAEVDFQGSRDQIFGATV